MDSTAIGDLRISRLLLGSNPFSGFSHQGVDRDERMVHHYTVARIKDTLIEAERLGITGFVARTDFHVMRMLLEYRDDGGKLVPRLERPISAHFSVGKSVLSSAITLRRRFARRSSLRRSFPSGS